MQRKLFTNGNAFKRTDGRWCGVIWYMDEHGDYTRSVNSRKRYYRILKAAGLETKGLHSLRHTFATNLVNGIKQPNGSIKSLTPRQVADLLGHSTSQIIELYYVKKDTSRLNGMTDGFEM